MKQAQDFEKKGSTYNTMANKFLDYIKLLTDISNSTKTKV